MPPASPHRLSISSDQLAEVQAIIASQLAASAAQYDLQGSFPHEDFALPHASGLTVQIVLQTHGGGGTGLKTARQIIASITHAGAVTVLMLIMTYPQHRTIIRADTHWPAHVRQQVSTTALDEGTPINTLRVESDLGMPARGGLPATVTTRVGNDQCIRGRKPYSTGSPTLCWLSTWGRINGTESRMGIFLVSCPSSGIPNARTEEAWDHPSLRVSGSHDVTLEDVGVSFDHAIDIRPASERATHSAAQADTSA